MIAQKETVPQFESVPLAEESSPPTIRSMKKRAIVTQMEVTKIPVVLQSTAVKADQEEDIDDLGQETTVEEEVKLTDIRDGENLSGREEDSDNFYGCETTSEVADNIEMKGSSIDKEVMLIEPVIGDEIAEKVVEPIQVSPTEVEDFFDENSLQKTGDENKSTKGSPDIKFQFPWTRSDTFDVIPLSQSSQISVPVKPKRGVVSPLQSQRHPTERDDTLGDITQSEKAPLERNVAESAEHYSDTSTFSQVSSNISSSFDYEVQYITPQLSQDKKDSTELGDDDDKTDIVEDVSNALQEKSNTGNNAGGSSSGVLVTVKVSKPSNSEGEEEISTK